MSEQRLRFELADGVATLTLDRPKANGIDLEMGKALMHAAIRCHEDAAVRAVLLTGAGSMFCAGGDLKSFATSAPGCPPACSSSPLPARGHLALPAHAEAIDHCR